MRLPGATRPVGEAVPLFPRSDSRFEWPAGFTATWLDSGTTALAIAARLLVRSSGKPEPRIVLPAYTCPDVVSAVLWSGARPVLADTLPGVPWLDEAALARHRDDSWVGVIAPHFMGLRHPMETLQRWCKTSGIGLIEDSAQLSPRSPAFQPAAELVVLSFGRGKPIPAGGGVLLALDKYGAAVGEITGALPFTGGTPLGWRARALMHDIAITRPGYRLASSLPGFMSERRASSRCKLPGDSSADWPDWPSRSFRAGRIDQPGCARRSAVSSPGWTTRACPRPVAGGSKRHCCVSPSSRDRPRSASASCPRASAGASGCLRCTAPSSRSSTPCLQWKRQGISTTQGTLPRDCLRFRCIPPLGRLSSRDWKGC